MPAKCALRDVMEKSWGFLDENDNPDFLWGEAGHQFLLAHAIRTSNHPIVLVVTILATLAGL
eukprot:6515539-Lingulodinium_polyedra.AAC.1